MRVAQREVATGRREAGRRAGTEVLRDAFVFPLARRIAADPTFASVFLIPRESRIAEAEALSAAILRLFATSLSERIAHESFLAAERLCVFFIDEFYI